MVDKNKTPKTHRATAIASAYLDSRGFKPIETEVVVYRGWIADLASFVYPTMTETKKLKLTGYKNILSDVKIEYNDFMYRYSSPLTAIVEVKVTKQDFKKDLERKFSGYIYPAHLCYIAYPKGIIEGPPAGWIGLEMDSECRRLLRVTRPVLRRDKQCYIYIHPQNPGDTIDLIANVAIRREHRTRYASMREWVKTYKAKEKERKKQSKVTDCISIISKWVIGDKFYRDKSLRYYIERNLRTNIPKYLDKDIKYLESLKSSTTSER